MRPRLPTSVRQRHSRLCAACRFACALFAITCSAALARAQVGTPNSLLEPETFSRNRGHWNYGLQVAYAVENNIPRNISHINLLYAQPQLGFIVRDFHASPVRRFEILSEGVLGAAVHPGGRLIGYEILFRLDGKARGRWVPFFDAGAGVLNTTINDHAPELSGHTQFNPQGGLGVQYFLRPQRALVFEYRYLHMSNNGIQEPNHGFNASMITIGFRWLRRPRP
jgi:lipid A 3-O-deacylase